MEEKEGEVEVEGAEQKLIWSNPFLIGFNTQFIFNKLTTKRY